MVILEPTTQAPETTETLRLWGFRSVTAATAEEALRLLSESQCIALVVDLDLPDVDVLGLVSAIRQHETTRHLPVLGMVSQDDGASVELARQSGCNAVLTGATDTHRLAMELEAALAHPDRACASV